MSAVLEFAQESYRTMNESDLPAVLSIERDAYEFPWSENIFRDCVRSNYECWVIELDGKTIGYVVALIMVGECHLLNLCIHSELQNQGYGRRALHKLLSFAKHKDATLAFLEVRPSNQSAKYIYESEGFNQAGIRRNYYPAAKGREDALIMAKQL